MMDPFEEFEFKPLTEGLGFHTKNKKEKAPSFSVTGMDLLESETDSPLRSPLPRDGKIQFRDSSYDDSSAAVDEILQTLRSKKIENPGRAKAAPSAAAKRFKASYPNLSAMFLDSMLVLAATLLCMIIVLSITKVDVAATFFSEETNPWIYISTLGLFAVVAFVYLTVNRIFLGATPGEWAYDQRVGEMKELGTSSYAVGVILRAAVVVVTGIFTLPMISLIMKKDLAGQISTTQILERV